METGARNEFEPMPSDPSFDSIMLKMRVNNRGRPEEDWTLDGLTSREEEIWLHVEEQMMASFKKSERGEL